MLTLLGRLTHTKNNTTDMRAEFLFVLALALFASAAPAPEAEANAAAAADADAHGGSLLSKRDRSAFGKRDCIKNGCECSISATAGMYCEACPQILKSGKTDVFSGNVRGWAYQCSSTGECCALGPHDSCANGNTNPCG